MSLEFGPSARWQPGADLPFRGYLLRCEARVNGEVFVVQVQVDASLYDRDPEARRCIENELRDRLLRKIMERFPPRVYLSE